MKRKKAIQTCEYYYTKEKESIDSHRELTKIYGKTCFHRHRESVVKEEHHAASLLCQTVSEEEESDSDN